MSEEYDDDHQQNDRSSDPHHQRPQQTGFGFWLGFGKWLGFGLGFWDRDRLGDWGWRA